jgi:hypothetical protein
MQGARVGAKRGLDLANHRAMGSTNLRLVGLLIVLGTASACAQPDHDPNAEDSSKVGSADDGSFAASASTRDALGVAEWKASDGGFAGYNAGGQLVVELQYRATTTSASQSVLQMQLNEPGRVSTAAVGVAAKTTEPLS